MSSCCQQEALSSQLLDGNLVTEEEDEEEDVDFNPFLKETSSPEASSSLSSDDEGVGTNVADNTGVGISLSLSLNSFDGNRNCTQNGEEVVTQSGISPQEESESGILGRPMKRKSAFISVEKNTSSSGNDFGEDVNKGVSTDALCSLNDTMEFDDEDAICRRTRARYSLANFSLDELENFLQETDDEDWQNVDDEQEYRKFLAAVLQGGDCESQSIQENENVDDEDEDEDSDADFDIEIEEALDSDLDENMRGKENRAQEADCQPKTRQNNHSRKFLGQANRPLRPLLPIAPNAVFPPFTGFDRQMSSPNSFSHCTPSSQAGLVNGFTPHQIGQLHCLIHEHTQLLVQVFSLCVLDPSRQQIADETRRLISELVHKRDKVLSWRKVPYFDFCFCPPYIHSSVSDELPKSQSLPFPVDSSSSGREKEVVGTKPVSHSSSSFGGRCNDGGHVDSLQTTKDSLWVPRISGPVLSILDATPLGLLNSYMDDVSRAVQAHRKSHIEALYDTPLEKKPLFPLFITPTSPEGNSEALRGTTSQGSTTASSSLNGHQPPKKTLAALLVESTKKQSIAFAPKEIVSLAQRFYPLFNPALYPHKPPPQAVANRVLFTDTEDELLALGVMEYNTDWKAIQQRFLPCKSKHQIFVRQKNRCSSKAPENPIKAVRRMKTSPLTAEEMDLIHKGLKVFRLDWMSVWRFLVPYRDPSLLSRQWRVAMGTQKSYKSDAAKKEKRRLCDIQRKQRKAAASANWQTASEKEDNNADEGNRSENDNMEDEDEAYVHEAFLADWRPGNSENHEFLSLSSPQHLQNASHLTHVRYSASYTMASNPFSPDCLSKPSKSQVILRPRRAPRQKDARLVKLAPELPPVNLPPSVRVISQSAFKSYHSVTSHSTKISSSCTATENLVPRLAPVAKPGTTVSVNSGNKGCTPSSPTAANICQEDPRVHSNQFASEDNCADADLQMHPLLLQAPEDGPLPYRPVNSNTRASNTFNFIAGNQLQANFSHFCKPSDAGSLVDGFYTPLSSKNPSKSCAIDFHPLLQRKDDGNITQLRISSDSVMTEPHVTSRPQATTPMPASPREIANELDLEIHLSSIPRAEKVTTGRKAPGHEYNGSRNLLNFGILKETNRANSSAQERSEKCATAFLEASLSNQRHVSGDHTLGFSNRISRSVGYVGDQSLPEIVMEQEELSDSEDENGEDVEFECEEMDDSEREESDCE